jgi:hypothetical protein
MCVGLIGAAERTIAIGLPIPDEQILPSKWEGFKQGRDWVQPQVGKIKLEPYAPSTFFLKHPFFLRNPVVPFRGCALLELKV